MKINPFLLFAFLFLLVPPLMAQEELETLIEEDFKLELSLDSEASKEGEEFKETSPFRYTLDHGVSQRIGGENSLINNRSGFSVEYAGMITPGFFVKIDVLGNLYWSNDHVAKSEGETYQAEGFIREGWLQRSYKTITFKIGYQNIVWNEVQGSLATDLINPLDRRELFFVDFEEARISQIMLSFSAFGESVTWEGFINPLPQFDKNPPVNSIYHMASPLDDYTIQSGVETTPEAGIRSQFKAGKSEVAFMIARLLPNQKGYALVGSALEEAAEPFWMVGASFNYPSGTILWKGDLGYKTNQGINDQSFGLVERDVIDFALGVEYTVSEHLWTASLSNSYIQDWDATLLYPEKTSFLMLGWTKSYLSEDLSLNAGVMGIVNKPVKFFTLVTNYKFNDELSLQGSLFLFSIKDAESVFYPFGDEHRASVKISYKF